MADRETIQGRRVLVGVTGGIAAYKAAEVVRRLKERGAEVRVVMTRAATEFVGPVTFEALSQNEVAVELFPREGAGGNIRHIALAHWADLLLIAPATANLLGKFANGIADDLLSSILIAASAPVVFAPAMETQMWVNPITAGNVAKLRALGYRFVGPESGPLASGAEGVGRLVRLEAIIEAVLQTLNGSDDLAGVNVLVTAGRTEEDLDPVRFLTNRSTGRMGYALARCARRRGASVLLISGPTPLDPPEGVDLVRVRSADEMLAQVHAAFDRCDVLFMAAAVADYRPAVRTPHKLKKAGDTMSLPLEPVPDLFAAIGPRKGGRILIGFALETEHGLENARAKLLAKHLDLIALNDPLVEGAGFAVPTNVITLLSPDGAVEPLPRMSKDEVADILLDRVVALRRSRGK